MSDNFEKQIVEALDLNTWDEYKGFTSVFGPKCPHCEHQHDPPALNIVSCEFVCSFCAKTSVWRSYVDLLMKQRVWQTRILVRRGTKAAASANPTSGEIQDALRFGKQWGE